MSSKAISKHIVGRTKDGRYVYRTLRFCNRIPREFWLTLDPRQIFGESTGKSQNMSAHFDVRDLPQEFVPADNYKTRNQHTFELIQRPADWATKAIDAGIDPVACTLAAEAKRMSEGGAQ